MQVANRHCQRISGIVRRWHLVKTQQQLHHLPDLRLLGAPIADDRALDLGRGVLDNRDTGLGGGQHGHAARVTQLEGTARVHGVKNVLDRHAVGTLRGNQGGELPVNDRQLLGKGGSHPGVDRSTHHQLVAPAVAVHAAVARAPRAGVDTKHSHASEASISFSSMSKLDHTCLTSS